jgi:hypothetical protein
MGTLTQEMSSSQAAHIYQFHAFLLQNKEKNGKTVKQQKNGPSSVNRYSTLEVQDCSDECTSDYVDTSPTPPSVFVKPSRGVSLESSAADVKLAVLNSPCVE